MKVDDYTLRWKKYAHVFTHNLEYAVMMIIMLFCFNSFLYDQCAVLAVVWPITQTA